MFTILHTNDFHNHLSEAQARRLQALRCSLGTEGLLLDAGDAISAGNITFHFTAEPILERMCEIGYDAMTVGNREFHFSRTGFHCKVGQAGFPVLCANVRPTRNNQADIAAESASAADPPVQAHIVHDLANGSRVVVFGLTVPMITPRMLARKVSAYVFDDPIETARVMAANLRQTLKPDLLIALTHIGIQQDRALAATVPEIDLIVGGHTHVALNEGERVGSTLIVQAGWYGHYYGKVEAELPGARPRLRATLEAL